MNPNVIGSAFHCPTIETPTTPQLCCMISNCFAIILAQPFIGSLPALKLHYKRSVWLYIGFQSYLFWPPIGSSWAAGLYRKHRTWQRRYFTSLDSGGILLYTSRTTSFLVSSSSLNLDFTLSEPHFQVSMPEDHGPSSPILLPIMPMDHSITLLKESLGASPSLRDLSTTDYFICFQHRRLPGSQNPVKSPYTLRKTIQNDNTRGDVGRKKITSSNTLLCCSSVLSHHLTDNYASLHCTAFISLLGTVSASLLLWLELHRDKNFFGWHVHCWSWTHQDFTQKSFRKFLFCVSNPSSTYNLKGQFWGHRKQKTVK